MLKRKIHRGNSSKVSKLYLAIKEDDCKNLSSYLSDLNKPIPTEFGFSWHPIVIAIHFNAFESFSFILANCQIDINKKYNYSFRRPLANGKLKNFEIEETLLNILVSFGIGRYTLDEFTKTANLLMLSNQTVRMFFCNSLPITKINTLIAQFQKNGWRQPI